MSNDKTTNNYAYLTNKKYLSNTVDGILETVARGEDIEETVDKEIEYILSDEDGSEDYNNPLLECVSGDTNQLRQMLLDEVYSRLS